MLVLEYFDPKDPDWIVADEEDISIIVDEEEQEEDEVLQLEEKLKQQDEQIKVQNEKIKQLEEKLTKNVDGKNKRNVSRLVIILFNSCVFYDHFYYN